MHRELTQVGLGDKEAKVYLALLELGSSRVQEISHKAGIHRTTTYVILESLAAKGLVSAVDKGKIRYFSPESPDHLISYLRDAETEVKSKLRLAEKIMPRLEQLFSVAEEKPRVRFYEGKDGIRKMLKDFWKTQAKEVWEALSLEDYYNTFSEKERDELVSEASRRNIRGRVLFSAANPKLFRGVKAKNTEVRFVPAEHYPFDSDIEVSGNKVIFASLKGKLVGVMIENEAIANAMRSLFKMAWELAGKMPNRK